MKVVHLSFSSSGGAGRVGKLISGRLRSIGVDSRFFSLSESNLRTRPFEHPLHTLYAGLDDLLVKARTFNSQISVLRSSLHSQLLDFRDYDVVNFHWVEGLIDFSKPDLFHGMASRRIVWTLHDMRSLTGACHYSGSCTNHLSGCSNCPAVRKFWRKKVSEAQQTRLDFIKENRVNLICPSDWIFQMSRELLGKDSHLCKRIDYPVSETFFSANSLPASSEKNDSKIRFVIIANDLKDPRKCVQTSISLYNSIKTQNCELHLIGQNGQDFHKPGESVIWRGVLNQAATASVFAACDFMIFNSLEDNSPMVILEALAAGLPIIHNENSAGIGSLEASGSGIPAGRILRGDFDVTNQVNIDALKINARLYSKKHKSSFVAAQYKQVYEEILAM